MSLLLSLALAASASAVTLPSCSWDRPGRHAFVGDVVAAVDRYADIPAPVRAALKRRMAARQYDEIATIERSAITGQFRYAPEIRDMHFGSGQVCNTVTRNQWSDAMRERGLVYCEGEHCIIVPTVCRNVARVTRLSDRRAGEGSRRDPAQPAVAAADAAVLVEALPGAGSGPAAAGFDRLAGPAAAVGDAAGPGLSSGPAAAAGDATAAPGSLAARVASDGAEPLVVATASGLAVDAAAPVGGGGSDGSFPPIFGPLAGAPSAPSPGPLPQGDAAGDAALTPIPEPGSAVLWLAGLAVLGWLVRRRR